MTADWIIVGLGNPGPRYALTRHNIGFIALDFLTQTTPTSKAKFSTSGLASKVQAELCELDLWGKKLLLIKPLTFMNLSGESLAKLYAQQNHLREAQIVCLHDEVDIPFKEIKVKKGGGDAGHNGLKSLREHLGHGDFYRIRLGVGRPVRGSQMELADYVLQGFNADEKSKMPEFLIGIEEVLRALICDGLEIAHRKAADASKKL